MKVEQNLRRLEFERDFRSTLFPSEKDPAPYPRIQFSSSGFLEKALEALIPS
jgi:hypothetical protein